MPFLPALVADPFGLSGRRGPDSVSFGRGLGPHAVGLVMGGGQNLIPLDDQLFALVFQL
jgi:hypothetical protein